LKLKKNSFTRNERLRTAFEFKKVRKKSHLYFNQGPVKIYILKQNSQYSRLGIVIYKKTAKAFFRNKIKRWVREIFRTTKVDFRKKLDIVFVIGPGEKTIDLLFLQHAFLTTLKNFQG